MFTAPFRLSAICLPLLAAPQTQQGPVVGRTAPPITLERMVPAGALVTLESLRGRPVVIEFWATWCGPCIGEISHFNELALKFPEAAFISITDEQPAVVEAFLAKRPIAGQVGLDLDRSTFLAYRVEAIPQTVLVDKDGVVRAGLHPWQLTSEVLADLVAGRPLSLRRHRQPVHIFEGATGGEPLFAVALRPSANPKPGGVFNLDPGMLQGTNLSLKTIIAHACSVNSTRLEGPEDLFATRWDFCVMLPRGVEGDVAILREMLERTFRLKIRRETREMDALVLTAVDPKIPQPERAIKGLPISALARHLEGRLKRYVVDETGLSGGYDFEYPNDNRALEAYVRQLGLALTPAKRPIEFVVVESLELPLFR